MLCSAQHEACRLGYSCTGTEHLLLALIDDQAAPTSRLLARFGADPDQVRAEVRSHVPPRQVSGIGRCPPFASEVNEILALFVAAHDAPPYGYIGPEHLLFGVMSDGHSVATKALAAAGLDVPAARAQVLASLG